MTTSLDIAWLVNVDSKTTLTTNILAGKHCERLGGQSRPQKIKQNDNGSFHFFLEIFDILELGHEEPTKNAQERGNDRKDCPNDTRDVKDFGIGLILVHAFEINEMLTKDGDSTTDTEDGDEDAGPESGGD